MRRRPRRRRSAGRARPTAPRRSAPPLSPDQRAWARFKRNRLGYVSLLDLRACCWSLTTCAEVISNDRPLVARYDGQLVLPARSTTRRRRASAATSPRRPTGTIRSSRERFAKPGNLRRLHAQPALGRLAQLLQPRRRTRRRRAADNWLGTDDAGRDMLARLLYGFRISVWFALALTADRRRDRHPRRRACRATSAAASTSSLQRFIEIWGAVPELYLLIIFASIFEPSILLLLVLLALFGWIGLSDYVRAEFLRNRSARVRQGGARAGPVERADHLAPRAAELDDAGDHLPAVSHERGDPRADLARLPRPGRAAAVPSLGELLRQGKDNLDAWWIIVPTFARAGADAAAADLHRRRAARRLRHAQVMSDAPTLRRPARRSST